jgi:polyisoprenoid-binding protein YceI
MEIPMKTLIATAALAAATLATPVLATSDAYILDAGHSQIVFTYDHLGYSTTYGMFTGFEGEIDFNQADPATSSVNVSFPVRSMLTGWKARFEHFMSADFFAAGDDEMVTFASTGSK